MVTCFPYVPIASGLSRRGHDVTYVVPREFHGLFASEPFGCAHSGTDFSPVALDGDGAYIVRWGMALSGAGLLPLYFGRFTVPHLAAMFEAVDAELADADLLVSHPAASLIGAMSCERRGIPWIVGDLSRCSTQQRLPHPPACPTSAAEETSRSGASANRASSAR